MRCCEKQSGKRSGFLLHLGMVFLEKPSATGQHGATRHGDGGELKIAVTRGALPRAALASQGEGS